MKFGFSLVVRGADATPDTFAQVAERAEALAIDSLWLSAHVILPPQVQSGYAMVPGLAHPPHWHEGYWEPFTVMAYLAAVTERIQIGTSVLVLPQHNPFEVAKQIAQVDQLSGGRVVFGLGVGWFEEEFKVLGQDFANRGKRTDDALRLMQKLWTEEPVTYDGEFYAVKDGYFSPKPVQKPYPPIWVAGGSRPAFRRAAEFADTFHPVRVTPERLTEMGREVAELAEGFGRARDAVSLAAKLPLTFTGGPPGDGEFLTQGRPQDIADGLKRYRDAGSEHFVLDIVPETRHKLLDTMERFAEEVRPKLD